MAKEKKSAIIKKAKVSESYLSMALGLLVVIIFGILLFNFFKGRKTELSLPGIQAPTEQEQQGQPSDQLPTKHIVNKGESLWKIAQRYYESGYNWVSIAKANNLSNPNVLAVGQELTIPEAEKITPRGIVIKAVGPAIEEQSYTIMKGDNLWKIAVRAYGDGFQWIKIAQVNSIVNPDIIQPGTTLKIPR